MIVSYKDLDVCQLAMNLAEDCYRLTRAFPTDERYGLTSQIRRASVSMPANIAEGYGRDQTGSYIQFLRVALGSANELETLLLLSSRLGITAIERDTAHRETVTRVSKMLISLIWTLESKQRSK